jgi:hypothetical protein
VPPAPLFIYNAWTDDLFPADETIRFARKTLARYPSAEIALLYADDFGHSRAMLGFSGAAVLEKVTTFLARHLKGTGDAFPPLQTYTQACNGATVEGPFTATDWAALHPSEVRYKSKRTQRFSNTPGLAADASATDPLNIALGPCRTVAAEDELDAATYRLPAATGTGYTLVGSPTVIGVFGTTGPNAQIVARLWDVGLDGNQTLVAHAVYRPRTDNRGVQVFQLHPNAWRFADGHVAKLELLGQSKGYLRPSNGAFEVTVSELELRLPALETPFGQDLQEAVAGGRAAGRARADRLRTGPVDDVPRIRRELEPAGEDRRLARGRSIEARLARPRRFLHAPSAISRPAATSASACTTAARSRAARSRPAAERAARSRAGRRAPTASATRTLGRRRACRPPACRRAAGGTASVTGRGPALGMPTCAVRRSRDDPARLRRRMLVVDARPGRGPALTCGRSRASGRSSPAARRASARPSPSGSPRTVRSSSSST